MLRLTPLARRLMLALTLVFAAANIPMLVRHGLGEDKDTSAE